MTSSVRTAREALKVRILDLLDSEDKPMTTQEIGSSLSCTVTSDTVRRAMAELVASAEVSRTKAWRGAYTFWTDRGE